MKNKIWLTIFCTEIVLSGIFICTRALVAPVIRTNYTVYWELKNGFSKPGLAFGILLILIGIFIIAIPKVNLFLRSNRISSYLIPMHIWIVLALIGVELVVRVTVFNLPFGGVYTNWFGWVYPRGSFFLWGEEGYAITHYDGPLEEIHTPFQGGPNIILLGDSFTEALQVPDHRKITYVI